MHFLQSLRPRYLLILALAAVGAGLCALLVPAEMTAVEQQLIGFPDSDIHAHQARPLVLGALCFLPTLACFIYCLGGTLDRYLSRLFLGIFGICLSALFLIWLLIDLTDKIGDFRNAHHILGTILTFYATRTPPILLLILPFSLLLALLYTLGRLSTNREIIAMIQSGRGVLRIALPLMITGGFCTLFNLGLNYHWAPTAEGLQEEILAEASDKPATKASHVLYRNAENRRLWMIGSFPSDYQKGKPLLNVEVTTTDPHHILQSRLFATQALWDRTQHVWTFQNAIIGRYTPGRPPTFETPAGQLVINSWSETPWQLIKPGLSAAYLGIPDLNGWLQSNARHLPFADPAPYLTQWHYRWALPFSCLVNVLLATPLAIHFSRRGPGTGIFLAIVLAAFMLLISNITLAFGSAGTLRPALAAWLPNIAFTLLGIYLFRRHLTVRPLRRSLRQLLPGRIKAES
jgi:LPS export ABC transporter permease LptG